VCARSSTGCGCRAAPVCARAVHRCGVAAPRLPVNPVGCAHGAAWEGADNLYTVLHRMIRTQKLPRVASMGGCGRE